MEWQAIVLVMQILMLAVGWFLFQQARGELSARAAETPILGEVKALQRSIKQLLIDLEMTSDRSSLQLETKCDEARQLLQSLNITLDEINSIQARTIHMAASEDDVGDSAGLAIRHSETFPLASTDCVVTRPQTLIMNHSPRELSREKIFSLSDSGQTPAAIACATGLSEGEIEMLLGLRLQQN